MRTTTSRFRRLSVTAGLAGALFSIGLALPTATAESTHVDQVETASIDRSGSLPGSDSPIPVAAAGFLLGSAGVAWVVRRSSPAAA